jgi:hypothetical protein
MEYRADNLVEVDCITDRQFALCESCFWSATVFETMQNTTIINFCPVCSNSNIALIPLTNNEAYKLCVGSKGGLEIKFMKTNKY